MDRGFYFTAEALLSFILLVSLVTIAPLNNSEENLNVMYVKQKQNDVIKIWLAEGTLEESKITEDLDFVFRDSCWELQFNNKKIKNCDEQNTVRIAITSTAYILERNSEFEKIKLTVFY